MAYIKYDKRDVIDLNEANVMALLNYCAANAQTAPDDIISANFFTEDSQMNVPSLKFSKSKLFEKRNTIYYILGQLRCVHDNSVFAEITSGAYKYDGTVWSMNNAAVFSLYYLGCASGTFPQFKANTNVNQYLADFAEVNRILPTLSPNDSEFENWAADHTE